MTVSELAAFLATQPQDALVLIASQRQTFGDIRAETRAAFTYGGQVQPCFLSRAIIHEDDVEFNKTMVPVITIGAPI